MVSSVDDIFGMLYVLGKKSTVFKILSTFFLGKWDLWHI